MNARETSSSTSARITPNPLRLPDERPGPSRRPPSRPVARELRPRRRISHTRRPLRHRMLAELIEERSRQTGEVSFESVSAELYGMAPGDFTAARNARMSEARQSGNTALAGSLKTLRKPTVGAWLSNVLAHERADDLQQLITLGSDLRKGQNRADGELIRTVSKKKQKAIAALVAEAKAIAVRRGQPVSEAAAIDLESTLDAAFSDPEAAATVRAGRLTSALHYSGLGFADAGSDLSVRSSKADRPREPTVAAKRHLESANREADAADADVEKARRAVAVAEKELKRLKTVAAVAARRAADAHKKATAAKKRLER
jgi:hypothetical protein